MPIVLVIIVLFLVFELLDGDNSLAGVAQTVLALICGYCSYLSALPLTEVCQCFRASVYFRTVRVSTTITLFS